MERRSGRDHRGASGSRHLERVSLAFKMMVVLQGKSKIDRQGLHAVAPSVTAHSKEDSNARRRMLVTHIYGSSRPEDDGVGPVSMPWDLLEGTNKE